ncbi:hypothetical protein [Saccharothrix algeriensis]|uniref:Uncharacterized protein n=1 Tax=Saccharothrix algeriensis TaxID=173560 RepID=A0A8T8HR25_9PSEU|nr:hypothetical protein [Saccharothrix algeriensis]MBM7812289.1 hypothetical protein [Saccharothrix algeriensis]QTR01073.1 hypothetical protein J7S33_16225 [Saccharothrix algeriensis]
MGTALLHGLIGLAVLLVLWPTRSAAARFLRSWGVANPTEAQAEHAVRYLRHRRLLYPPLFLLVPSAGAGISSLLRLPEPADNFLAPVIVALLIAEAVAALRPVRGPRVAALTRRRWRDLVPRWAIGLLLGFAGAAALLAGVGLTARSWALRAVAAEGHTHEHRAGIAQPVEVVVLVGAVLGLAAVLGVVRLAVRRGSVADPVADAALRTRSARVAVGIGMAWQAWMVNIAFNRLVTLSGLTHRRGDGPGWLALVPPSGLVNVALLLVAVVGWIWVANASGRVPYVAAAEPRR